MRFPAITLLTLLFQLCTGTYPGGPTTPDLADPDPAPSSRCLETAEIAETPCLTR